ncbi:hypothetical protein ACI8AF_14270 [Blastococcus sp. SYSU D00669]
MTSGQGGFPEQPTGQPGNQGWDGGQQGAPGQGAPPPQGYPAAPPAQPGYPPAPGYGPAPAAPAAPWGGGPKPVERPATVRFGIGAFVASLILGVIGTIVTFADLDSLVDRAVAEATAQGGTVDLTEDAVRAVLVVSAVIGLVIVGLEAMFMWFAWNGRNWARIVLFVIGGFGIVSGLFALGGGDTMMVSGFLQGLSIFQFLLVLAGVVLLAMKPSNEWYRYRGWLRATGQRG